MERFGLVGLPNAGKSSLFNALTGAGALAAPYAFATKDPNVGMSKVPDERLDRLAAMSKSKNVVAATVQVVDIGGLVEGASKGEGLGNRFLGGIREVDAIVFVLRAFADDDVPGPDDPLEHLRIVEIELALADLETVEGRLGRTQKAARADRSMADEVAALEAANAALSRGAADLPGRARPRRPPTPGGALPADEQAGAGRRQRRRGPARRGTRARGEDRRRARPGADVLGMCVQLEAEAIQLDVADRAEMLDALGLGEGALPRMVRAAYHLLGLRTFFTTGEKESRAWTFRAGAKAPECAGRIHTDMQRGFIRAEVVHWDELLELGSWNKAKDVGKLRVEGKDYEVVDGDVMEIRFNVYASAE